MSDRSRCWSGKHLADECFKISKACAAPTSWCSFRVGRENNLLHLIKDYRDSSVISSYKHFQLIKSPLVIMPCREWIMQCQGGVQRKKNTANDFVPTVIAHSFQCCKHTQRSCAYNAHFVEGILHSRTVDLHGDGRNSLVLRWMWKREESGCEIETHTDRVWEKFLSIGEIFSSSYSPAFKPFPFFLFSFPLSSLRDP